MSPAYKSTPDEIKGMPSGIPYIVGNEAAERFSFYGMKAILMTFLSVHVFMTMDYEDTGEKFNKDQAEALATQWIHWFNVAVYILPFIGATLSDWLFGKYKTILVTTVTRLTGENMLDYSPHPPKTKTNAGTNGANSSQTLTFKHEYIQNALPHQLSFFNIQNSNL